MKFRLFSAVILGGAFSPESPSSFLYKLGEQITEVGFDEYTYEGDELDGDRIKRVDVAAHADERDKKPEKLEIRHSMIGYRSTFVFTRLLSKKLCW